MEWFSGWFLGDEVTGDLIGPLVDWGRDWPLGTDSASARSPFAYGPIGSSHGLGPGAPLGVVGRLHKVVTFVGARAL